MTIRIPKYRRRPDRDAAFVEVGGKRIPLPGKTNSPESLAAYELIVKQAIRAKADKNIPRPKTFLSVFDLIEKYLDWAKIYYFRGNGRHGGEYSNLRDSLKILAEKFEETLVENFGPLALKEVQSAMIASGLCRSTINDRVDRIKRMFKWGVANELLRPEIYQALATVDGIRKGKSAAKEPLPIAPVDLADVDALLPYLTPVQTDMVTIHKLTGMRSDNLCALRLADVDRAGEIWLYRPTQHKGTHLDKSLVIPFGPKCQAILQKYLERPAESFLFSPRESETQRREAQRKARKTPLTTSQAIRQPKTNPKPKGRKGIRYTPGSYRRMIWYAIEKANVDREKEKLPPIPHWHPHQLRHTVGTEVSNRYGVESARVFLGHEHVKVTEIYAERDLDLARQIAREMG